LPYAKLLARAHDDKDVLGTVKGEYTFVPMV
jgi:hypothetical protein